jgi:transcriptional regulator with XRE-family HTH domain
MDSRRAACHSKRMVASAKLLKAARLALGLNLDEIAAAAGIDRRTVSRVESRLPGQKALGSAVEIERALERMGVIFLKAADGQGEGFRLPMDDR